MAQTFFNIRNQSEGVVSIDIDGVVGDWWDGNDTTTIRNEVNAIEADRIVVNLNSLGGDLYQGLALHGMLAMHPAKVEVNIYGMAASAATIVAMAGDEVKMASTAKFLIHKVWTMAVGNANDIEQLLEELKMHDKDLVNLYEKRTGMNRADIEALMNENNGNGIWLNAEEAQEMGFVDSIYETVALAACVIPQEMINKIPSIKTNEMTLTERLKNIAEKVDSLLSNQTEEVAEETTEEVEDETTEEVEETEAAADEATAEQVEAIENRFNALQEVITDHQTKADGYKAKVSEMESTIADLKAKVKELENEAADGADVRGEAGNTKNADAWNALAEQFKKR